MGSFDEIDLDMDGTTTPTASTAQKIRKAALPMGDFQPTPTGRPGWQPAPDDTPLPDLAFFSAHYGVAVSDIGEDGEVAALGHVGKLRALAAFHRHARTMWGVSLDDGCGPKLTVADALLMIQHCWMVNRANEQDWFLVEATEDTPGAFPVTIWAP